jgi:hypothetical protein
MTSARPVKLLWAHVASMTKITATHGLRFARRIERHKLHSYQLMASVKREHLNTLKPHTYIPLPPQTNGSTTQKEQEKPSK